jgi:ribosomal protein S21
MVECRRKKGETFEAFVRRFNKKIMQSGVILQFKKVRFHTKKTNRNLRRQSALMRLEKKGQYEYLKKVGRIKEDERTGRR